MNRISPRVALAWAVGLTLLGVVARLLPHAPNFTPAASIGLFAGFFFPRVGAAVVVTLVMMLASDSIVGFYEPAILATVYGSLLAPLAFRGWLRKRLSVSRVAIAASTSSLVFFLATNLAVWRHWYEPTLEGLAACYIAALPFLKYTLAGDLVWTFTLFGFYVLIPMLVEQRHGVLVPIRVETKSNARG